jgi:plasmid stabilization system protein ParE
MVGMLVQHPFAGQAGSGRGLRRIVASPYTYIIVYSVTDEEIIIHTVRHTARRPLA